MKCCNAKHDQINSLPVAYSQAGLPARFNLATFQPCNDQGTRVKESLFQTSTPVVGDGFQNREADLVGLASAIQRPSAGEPQ